MRSLLLLLLSRSCADDSGFISISSALQCAPGPLNVFAVGDCANSATHPRPKAGVFAVRQGPPLADNLRRCLFLILSSAMSQHDSSTLKH